MRLTTTSISSSANRSSTFSARTEYSAALASFVRAEKIGAGLDVFAKEAILFLSFFRPEIRTVQKDARQAGASLALAAIQAVEAPELPAMRKLAEVRMD